MIKGNDIFISLDSTLAPFAATRKNDIQTSAEKIPVSSPYTGKWERHIVGRKKWSFTVSWLVGNPESIKNLLMAGNSYVITIIHRDGNTSTSLLTGTATCLKAEIVNSCGKLAQGTFSFDGNGALEEVEEEE